MKKTAVEEVLKRGSVRQKIKLYMTDIALLNLNSYQYATRTASGEVVLGTALLTERERDLCYQSIKEKKDIDYYNRLRTYNQAFLYLKDKLPIKIWSIYTWAMSLGMLVSEAIANAEATDTINDLLDLYPDKKSREEAHKVALKYIKERGGDTYKEKGSPAYIQLDFNSITDNRDHLIKTINSLGVAAKEDIVMFKYILSKELPIEPYKDWVKKEEQRLIQAIEIARQSVREISELSTTPLSSITPYNDIEAEITEEDKEDFKNAGL
jgi:hypothetical protein